MTDHVTGQFCDRPCDGPSQVFRLKAPAEYTNPIIAATLGGKSDSHKKIAELKNPGDNRENNCFTVPNALIILKPAVSGSVNQAQKKGVSYPISFTPEA